MIDRAMSDRSVYRTQEGNHVFKLRPTIHVSLDDIALVAAYEMNHRDVWDRMKESDEIPDPPGEEEQYSLGSRGDLIEALRHALRYEGINFRTRYRDALDAELIEQGREVARRKFPELVKD